VTKVIKKLALSKETLRTLEAVEMNMLGGVATDGCGYTNLTCNTSLGCATYRTCVSAYC
jgi:hypothetical protein